MRAPAIAGAAALAGLLIAAAPASAAVTVGSDLTAIADGGLQCGSPPDGPACTAAPLTIPGAQLTAPTDGVVVRWRIKVGMPGSVAQPVRFRVIRQSGGLAPGTGVGTSAAEMVPATPGVYTFATRLPIRAGDTIGIDCCPNPKLGRYFDFDSPTSTYQFWDEPLADGETAAPFPIPGTMELLVNADIEPDCDGDGLGDESQDSAVDCAPPETTITTRPKDKTKKKTATFEFSSNEPGSSFECSLDNGQFAGCTSPASLKVKKGRHSFAVRSTDGAGNVDASPATAEWKVKKKRKKRR